MNFHFAWFHRFSLISFVLLALSSCAPAATPTFFIPPTNTAPLIQITAVPALSGVTSVPTLVLASPTPVCTNNLTFVQDLTVPDGTNFIPGEPIDKKWLVSNSGTCNWDSRYRLKLISGDPMGAPNEQALYPARSGTKATLRILFTAPQNPGTYQNAWQASSPDGSNFGSEVFIQITVGQ